MQKIIAESINLQVENAISEKKKWISLTGLCNNNCIFCLDGDKKGRFHKSENQVKKEIDDGLKEGAARLVLSGGEPTIHPKIIDFVRYGKEKGYKKIQIISNGRMLAYSSFADSLKKAGLDEVTFSLHGHTKELHETLTGINGSFNQIITGIKNAQRAGFIVNTDTTITKINYRHLPETISFIHSLGINEVNLMSIVPFGNAWENRKEVLYKPEEVVPYLHKGIDFCKKKNMVLWFSRFPVEYLEGCEKYIESYKKIVEEVLAREEDFFRKPNCKGERCGYCGIRDVCDDIVAGLKDYSYAVYSEPPCLENEKMRSGKVERIKKAGSFRQYVEEIGKNSVIKRISCKSCRFDIKCRGIGREYARTHGFGNAKPIKN